MKHFPRLGLYKASNVTFNPETIQAVSYGWWFFVSLIEGKVVFNAYNYSSSTCKHQSKVRSLLNTLDIKIDLIVRVKESLHNYSTIEELLNVDDITSMYKFIENEEKTILKNERNREKRLLKKLEREAAPSMVHDTNNVLEFGA